MSDPAPPTPDWLEEFAIPATSSGAVLALDLDGHGLWAARLDRNRTVEAVITEPRITAPVSAGCPNPHPPAPRSHRKSTHMTIVSAQAPSFSYGVKRLNVNH